MFFGFRLIVQQNADGRCIKVFVLPAALCPEKRAQKADRQKDAASYQQVNDTHDNLLLFAATCVAILVNEIIVAVLIGINMAAISGDSRPLTA